MPCRAANRHTGWLPQGIDRWHDMPDDNSYLVQRSTDFEGPRVLLALELKPHAAVAATTTTTIVSRLCRGRGAPSPLPTSRPVLPCHRTSTQHVRQPWGRLKGCVPYMPYDSTVRKEGFPGNQVAGSMLERADAPAGAPPPWNGIAGV